MAAYDPAKIDTAHKLLLELSTHALGSREDFTRTMDDFTGKVIDPAFNAAETVEWQAILAEAKLPHSNHMRLMGRLWDWYSAHQGRQAPSDE